MPNLWNLLASDSKDLYFSSRIFKNPRVFKKISDVITHLHYEANKEANIKIGPKNFLD
jgi:hypothetical protein